MKKVILLLILLIFITNPFNAQELEEYGVWLHRIDIDVDSEGRAEISEKFHISFNNDLARIEFRQLNSIFGTDLTKWEEFNPQFKSNIGGERAVNKRVNYSEGDDSYLEINYSLSEPLMARGKETALIKEYSIKANYLNSLYDMGLWVIPEDTRVSIILPAGAEIKDPLRPQGRIQNYGSNRRIVTWEGYISSNELNFQYYNWKKIDPIIDLNRVNQFLFRTPEGLMIIATIILIIGIIILKRKRIAEKIENFVEANTILKED